MDAAVVWHGGMKFTGSADSTSEHTLTVPLDSAAAVGGTNEGLRPMEYILIGLAGCTAMDVISILRKKRQDVTAFEVKAHATQAEGHPHVFTSFTIEYIVTGNNIDEAAVQRAIELSETRYCPAQAMLKQVAPMELTYTIHATEA